MLLYALKSTDFSPLVIIKIIPIINEYYDIIVRTTTLVQVKFDQFIHIL